MIDVPVYRTIQYDHNGCPVARIDRRTADGVPYLHDGAWYDSYEAAEQFDHDLYDKPTAAMVRAEREAAERRRAAMTIDLEYVI